MLIAIVSATPFEIVPLRSYLEKHFKEVTPNYFRKDTLKIRLLITGVGMTQTAFSIGQFLVIEKPQLLLNVGIAGAFNRELSIGAVVNVISERFADLGVENADGSFVDVHELGLSAKDELPFKAGVLENEEGRKNPFLPHASGLTVNKVHGSDASIKAIRAKYTVDVESMEGAAVFYACLIEQVPFLEIRSISNYVEARNKDNWNIPLAIDNLNEVVIEMIKAFVE